jgi:serine/threonine protein kinase
MPGPLTTDQFIEFVSKSGLLDPQQLQARIQRIRVSEVPPEALADALVRDGLLTSFQASQLLKGKWRNFILSGKYKVLGPLGSGGMGHVYLCEHQIMRRRVAVKVLPPHSSDGVALARFHREARAVAQLKHTNIVGGYDVDRDGKRHFLVMEYIDGSTFQTLVENRGPLDPLRAAHYIRQTALGLQHAHEAGLVHRDIKPSNLVLDRTGTVKILDLGLARFFHDKADDLSKRHTESPVGTMDYMAPEQALNSHQADIRADIYSLGATFYFLLVGHGPFEEGTPLQKLIRHQFEPPKPVRDLRPDVPEELAAVIGRMMAKEPAVRYQTSEEVAHALVPWTRTPIPPPPQEEMPELVSSASGTTETGSGTGLPAYLYEPTAASTPSPARGADTARAPSSPSRSETFHIEDEAGHSSVTPQAGLVSEASNALAPIAPPVGQQANESAPATSPRSANESPPPTVRTVFPRRRTWLVLAAIAILLLGAGITGFALIARKSGEASPSTPDRQAHLPPADLALRLRLMVPAYFYPGGDGMAQWEKLLEARDPWAVVIIVNTASGPGKVADPNYVHIIGRAIRRGFTVIGYVSTGYGARPLKESKEDIDRWMRLYPGIRGIFFDEQASSGDRISYYAELYNYARRKRGLGLVINNPGTTCAEEYLARPVADVVCLIESTRDVDAFQPPAWMSRYKPSQFAGAFPRIDDPEKMKHYLGEMLAKRVGYCYITDGKGSNPWSRLPHYWEAEVEAVQQINHSDQALVFP